MLLNLLAALILIPFMTACHRAALQPDAPPPAWFSFRVGKSEFRFLWNSIVIVFCATVAALPFLALGAILAGPGGFGQATMTVFAVLGLCFALFVAARLSLILPAAAVDAPAGLRDSWRATSGQVIRIVAAQLLMQLCIVLLSAAFYAFLLPLVAVVATGGALVTGEDRGRCGSRRSRPRSRRRCGASSALRCMSRHCR